MIIPERDLASLASLYEEYMYAPDPNVPQVRQAKLIFDHECRQLLQQETIQLQERMDLGTYEACLVIPQILKYLDSFNRQPSV